MSRQSAMRLRRSRCAVKVTTAGAAGLASAEEMKDGMSGDEE
jgi:hypothetical protein